MLAEENTTALCENPASPQEYLTPPRSSSTLSLGKERVKIIKQKPTGLAYPSLLFPTLSLTRRGSTRNEAG